MRFIRSRRHEKGARHKLSTALGLIVCAILSMVWPVGDAMAADDLCFNSTSPLPTIDGVVTGDGGWRLSNQYVFQNAVSTPHAIVQMARSFGGLYLSFEVNNDPTFDDLDSILITLSPDGVAAHDHRILIHPVAESAGNAMAAPGGPPAEIKYWKDSSTSAWTAQTVPTWLKDPSKPDPSENLKVTSSSVALPLKSWVVEMFIPTTGISFSATSFKLYFNIIRVAPLGAVEFAWPPSAPPIGGTLPAQIAVETNTPPPATWGTGRREDACPGVKVLSVRTNHPTDANGIDPNSTNNRFKVKLTNTGTVDAHGVTATIKSYRFGVSGSFAPLPLAPPHINFGDVPALATSPELQTLAWDVLNDPMRTTYLTWGNVCSFVELNATGGLIANRFYPWNLHFATASRFQHVAVIDTNGFGPPASEGAPQRFDLAVATQHEELRRDSWDRLCLSLNRSCAFGETGLEADDGDRRRAALVELISVYYPDCLRQFLETGHASLATHVVHAYRATGRFIEIEGKRLPVWESANSFGYVLCHQGPVKEWVHDFSGPAVVKVPGASDRYTVEVPVGQFTEVTTTVEAREQDAVRGRWSFSLHGGINDPRGDFAQACDGDRGYGVDLEYLLNPRFAAELFFGRDRLDCGRTNPEIDHLAFNGKVYFDAGDTGSLRLFALAGVGRYDLDGGATENGYAVGGGAQINPRPRLGLELTGKYHRVDTSVADVELMTLQVGARFRF